MSRHEFLGEIYSKKEHEKAKLIDPNAEPDYYNVTVKLDMDRVESVHSYEKGVIVTMMSSDSYFLPTTSYEQFNKIWDP
jgi:hypothetical protein